MKMLSTQTPNGYIEMHPTGFRMYSSPLKNNSMKQLVISSSTLHKC